MAMTPEAGWNPWGDVVDLVGRKIEADAKARAASSSSFDQGTAYSIDEYGNAVPRGQAAVTAAAVLGSPAFLIGAGVLAVALYFAFTR